MLFSAARSQSRLQKEEIEEALIREIEESLREGEPAVDDTATDQNENLPSNPLRFVLHYLKYYRWPLLTIVALELGQAICQILIPKAVQGVIDSAIPLQGQPNVSIWSALSGPMKFFVILNIGILLFSRCSGALLVTVGPVLRRRVRSSLYRYLQGHSQRYFMGNFAGSLANRVAEVSMGVNHSLWTIVCDFWPVTVTLVATLVLLSQVHSGLALVMGLWTLGYISVSYTLAIRCREYAKVFAAARSAVSGRIVDAVTNVMNSKLFARNAHEREVEVAERVVQRRPRLAQRPGQPAQHVGGAAHAAPRVLSGNPRSEPLQAHAPVLEPRGQTAGVQADARGGLVPETRIESDRTDGHGGAS